MSDTIADIVTKMVQKTAVIKKPTSINGIKVATVATMGIIKIADKNE